MPTPPQRTALSSDAFRAELDAETQRFRRYNRPFVLLLLRIGREGATTTDAMKALDAAVAENVRCTDVFGRFGDDRLAVLLPEQTREVASQVVARIQNALADVAGAAVDAVHYGAADFASEDLIETSRLIEAATAALVDETDRTA